jgi:hypothetical protein
VEAALSDRLYVRGAHKKPMGLDHFGGAQPAKNNYF